MMDRAARMEDAVARDSGVVRDIRDAARRAPMDSGPDLTHDGLALEMGREWEDARFVAAWGRWLFFVDGRVWRFDDTLLHMTRAREFLRDKADALADQDSRAKELRRADTVARIVGMARSNETQAAVVDQWDADPWLLGTPDGTLDLRTGTLRPALPEDYITKSTAVAPAPPGAVPELWLRTLRRITGDDAELLAYLQRFFGYSLTGLTREHCFPFGFGTGANGKTVTVNTASGVMGDYACTIPTEVLMVSQNERHPTELARLRGVRLAIGSETEEGKRWAEARIKSLTGGEPIAARFMRQDFFEFMPTFKLFVVGNHRPSLRGVDEAMRRRLHLIPFTVTIPPAERDPDLPQKLRAEWPAILRWMVDGALLWQRDGLNPPDSVRAATDDYLSAEDAFSLWIEECAEPDPAAWESSGSLFASWKRWAEAAGEFSGGQKRFVQLLQERGYEPHRQAGTGLRGFRGLRLINQSSERWEP
jgi:putative DNA primase/helicase